MAQPIEWTDEARALLGTVRDQVIADMLGCSRTAVRLKRRELGIASLRTRTSPASVASIRWTRQARDLLGFVPDIELAKQLGCSRESVCAERRRLNIPAYQGCDWTQYDHLLGTMSDPELAMIVGCAPSACYRRRKQLGIPPPKLWSAKHLKLLGTMSDPKLAKRLGCTVQTVKSKRRELGIAPHRPDRDRWAKYDRLLGTMSDLDLAIRMNASRVTVWRRRKKLGIPDFVSEYEHPWRVEARKRYQQASVNQ